MRSTWEVEAGASWVQVWSELYGNTLFQKYKSKAKGVVNLGSVAALHTHALCVHAVNHRVEGKLVKVHFSHSKCVQTFSLSLPKWYIITTICIVTILYSRHKGGCESVISKYYVIYTKIACFVSMRSGNPRCSPFRFSLLPQHWVLPLLSQTSFMVLYPITSSLLRVTPCPSFHPRQSHSSLNFLFKQKSLISNSSPKAFWVSSSCFKWNVYGASKNHAMFIPSSVVPVCGIWRPPPVWLPLPCTLPPLLLGCLPPLLQDYPK